MAVTINLHLFGKPAHELDAEGETVEPAQVRQLADALHARLHAVADILEKLTGAGWEASMALYDVILWHPYIHSEADARGRIEDLGLNPDELDIWEDEEEEMEEMEEGEMEDEEPEGA
jgi:hypothetical protein